MFPEFRTRLFAHKRAGNALTAKSAGVMCLLALTAMCSTAFAKTALAQDYTAAVYVGTDDGQKNGLVAYRRKADGTLAYIGEYLSGGAGGSLNTGGPIDPLFREILLDLGNIARMREFHIWQGYTKLS